MPVCITGMHRSGTSMVARLLNLCGLSLGPEDELFIGAEDNPEGFWEHRDIVALNDDILAHFGGGWDLPPALRDGWELDPEMKPFLQRARALKGRFSEYLLWGWKDPRASLTMAFWTEVIPDLRLLICVRDPVEVVASLRKRGYSSPAFGFSLWRSYYCSLFAVVPLEACLVTQYHSYFSSPEAELRRVLKGLRMPISDEILRHALASISPGLRHNQGTDAAPLAVPPDVAFLYQQLCAAATRAEPALEVAVARVGPVVLKSAAGV